MDGRRLGGRPKNATAGSRWRSKRPLGLPSGLFVGEAFAQQWDINGYYKKYEKVLVAAIPSQVVAQRSL